MYNIYIYIFTIFHDIFAFLDHSNPDATTSRKYADIHDVGILRKLIEDAETRAENAESHLKIKVLKNKFVF